jgi:hypothetical protein
MFREIGEYRSKLLYKLGCNKLLSKQPIQSPPILRKSIQKALLENVPPFFVNTDSNPEVLSKTD